MQLTVLTTLIFRNYHQVLVLLLRLRQICSHPSLIAEDASALVSPEEAKQGVKLVFSSELTRASRLVSEEFVVKMKEKIKNQTLARARPEGNVCTPVIQMIPLTNTTCTHSHPTVTSMTSVRSAMILWWML